MRIILEYFYIHFYYIVSKVVKYQARESAVLYLTAIQFFLILPFAAHAVYRVLGNQYKIAFFAIILVLTPLRKLNDRYLFSDPKKLHESLLKLQKESRMQKYLGAFVVLFTFVLSPILSFWILSLL